MTDTLGYWAATSWEGGALNALGEIDYQSRLLAARRHHRTPPTWSLNSIDQVWERVLYKDGANADNYVEIGAEAWLQVPMSMNIAVQILANKQRDYGHSNIEMFGHTGLMVRLHDKIARLRNLLNTDREPRNEAIQDTWFDIVGYCVIGIMLIDKTFYREVSDDS